MVQLNLQSVAKHLELRDGIWYASEQTPVSYPDDGNRYLFETEDQSYWYRHRNNCILEVVSNFPPRGVLFDIGGGNGFVASALQKRGWQTVLVEPDFVGITNARKRGLSHLVCSGFQEAGFRDASVAAIGAFDVLEHIKDDLEFLRQIAACMQTGGRLYITVPTYNWLWSIEDEHDGHFRRYTFSQLNNLLAKAGLRIEYFTYFFTILPLPIFFCRRLGGRLRYHGRGALDSYHRKRTSEVIRRDHVYKSGWVHKALDSIWRFEARLIKRKKRFSFGTSCLLVATRNEP